MISYNQSRHNYTNTYKIYAEQINPENSENPFHVGENISIKTRLTKYTSSIKNFKGESAGNQFFFTVNCSKERTSTSNRTLSDEK